MTALHTWLNAVSEVEATQALFTCCAAERWVSSMLVLRPFASSDQVLEHAREVWRSLGEEDVLEAFKGHPQIGGDLDALKNEYGTSSAARRWSAQEQTEVNSADNAVLVRLRDANAAYLERFGYIFIVCASGKTALQMLQLMETRLHNPPELELTVAAREQEQILLLRLQKLTS